MKTKLIIPLCLIALLVGMVAAVLYKTYLIPSSGTITSISVSLPDTLDWGGVENATLSIWPFNGTNTGTADCTLTLDTFNWSPSIVTLDLTWNYTGWTIPVGSRFDLQLEQNITSTGPWSYTLNITAIEA